MNDFQTNEPYKNKYAETDAILKTAIAQIDIGLNELQHDISEIRASKTLKKKYDYLAMLQGTSGQFIGNKISAASPAVNIIDPHAKKEYFGFSLGSPNTMSPYFDKHR